MAVRLDPKVVPSNEERAMYTPVVSEDLLLALLARGYDGVIEGVKVNDQDETVITLLTGGIVFDIKISIKEFM